MGKLSRFHLAILDDMNRVDHDGIVQDIKGSDLMVSIITKSACASCQVKSMCNPSEMKEKIFEVRVSDASVYKVGEHIKLSITEGQGMMAVFLGYVIPIFTLLGGFITATVLEVNEPLSALSGVSLTGLYFFILYLTRNKTSKRFSFLVSRYEN